MRTYVSKMLVGACVANTSGAPKDPLTLTEGQIIAFDYETQGALSASSKLIGFARGSEVVGAPIIAGPVNKNSITAISNPYEAPVNQETSIIVAALPPASKYGQTVTFRVTYHDNLSIIPNQVKQTIVSVVFDEGDTTTTFADKIAAAFTAQDQANLFVTVTAATGIVTFTGLTIRTQSNYNHIDRPETLKFELGVPMPSDLLGEYAVSPAILSKTGQGDASKIAWLEEQHMGRQGFSDRRMWNDTKKYPSQVTPGETYDVLVINGDMFAEGDMQDLNANPVGAIIAGEGADVSLVAVDLATAGVTVVPVPAS